ncbi:hypothetical protein GLOTRDRAFT_96295 [Gloeophyllum trabeum ATCC 11539]|uniref:FHA domain-containing protein n=1 Tax=Gloeophyllum trabeum (strain ATCC 11539 / FP-39264 / Madison 617) TaxID=670483 RepID=S7RGA3_GLOTA|nr:uncharacterized protein GLOTRDRAFT_96295 [Gloeophyllum trabeum ATCC 11539]EPQ51554.1 hypothetical protein GLOTRDRAFT_96295 [Gloeophyllum trabeum ATCC 11539]
MGRGGGFAGPPLPVVVLGIPAHGMSRQALPYVHAIGPHFTSPRRRRPAKRDKERVVSSGRHQREKALLADLAHLRAAEECSATTSQLAEPQVEAQGDVGDWVDVDMQDRDGEGDNVAQPVPTSPKTLPKRILPDDESRKLYQRWLDLLPGLVPSLRVYREATHFENRDIVYCSCTSLPQALVSIGLFPTSPTQPRMAVSVDLLDFYFSLFERSGDAVTALAAAMRTFYAHWGWHILDQKGDPVRDPFRRALGYAIQWYDTLQGRANRDVERVVDAARSHVRQHIQGQSSEGDGDEGECASILQQRCPACFGGVKFGRSLSEGCDIQICVDGNFSQRHLRSAGDSPAFYKPEYFLSKMQVDDMGTHIDAQRRRPPSKTYVAKVPDEAVDSCAHGHEAADEHKTKSNADIFDDTGVMAAVCRHDIPLLLANIDTAGEQQKYALALVYHLFSWLPANATIRVLYDIGCVVDRSINLHKLLPEQMVSRLHWSTSVMHAYGHEWACRLIYNPRMTEGLGLTDGEGTERFWSKSRKLIPITRTSAHSRRIWLVDRQAAAIGDELREDLGDYIKRRIGREAEEELEACGVALEELRLQWELQRATQLSIRAHAPARLKKEVDVVLTLQAEIDSVEKAIASVQGHLVKAAAPPASMHVLQKLKDAHCKLVSRAEQLYISLNIQESFPHLQGVSYDFIRTIIFARDLKINIRKRAVANFLDWDRLDQAVGGKDNPLGALFSIPVYLAVHAENTRFNKYCDVLESLHKPEWCIPVPSKLSTDLGVLREDQALFQDVCLEPGSSDVLTPRWLTESNVRRGIRAMLKKAQCLEECQRLGMEADNMCQWFGRELAALELAMRSADAFPYLPELQHRLELIQLLRQRWANPLISSTVTDHHLKASVELAARLAGAPSGIGVKWMPPKVILTESDLQAMEVTVFENDYILAKDDDEDDSRDDGGDNENHSYPSSPGLVMLWEPLPADLQLLNAPVPINDECINGCAAVLFSQFAQGDCRRRLAVFSSFHLPLIRDGVTSDVLWRHVRHCHYWEREVWLIPIFRPGMNGGLGHWTLAIVHLPFQCILHFDSFADEETWHEDSAVGTMFEVCVLPLTTSHDPGCLQDDMALQYDHTQFMATEADHFLALSGAAEWIQLRNLDLGVHDGCVSRL